MSFLENICNFAKKHIEERQRERQAIQQAQQEQEIKIFLECCKRVFSETLDGFPSIYNVNSQHTPMSLHAIYKDNVIELKIPKEKNIQLRTILLIDMRNELQARIKCLYADSQRMLMEFQQRKELEYSLLMKKVGYDNSHPEVQEFQRKISLEYQQMEQTLRPKSWQYEVVQINDDGKDEPYMIAHIRVRF